MKLVFVPRICSIDFVIAQRINPRDIYECAVDTTQGISIDAVHSVCSVYHMYTHSMGIKFGGAGRKQRRKVGVQSAPDANNPCCATLLVITQCEQSNRADGQKVSARIDSMSPLVDRQCFAPEFLSCAPNRRWNPNNVSALYRRRKACARKTSEPKKQQNISLV